MGTIEKRKTPRIFVDFVSVEIYILTNASTEPEIREICPVRNISESGMMFEAEKAFDAGAVLRLTFALPDSPIVIRTNAIVIHSTRKKTWEVGVQFKNLVIVEQKLLKHYIGRFLAKTTPLDFSS